MTSTIPYNEEQALIDQELATLRAQTLLAERKLITLRNALSPAAKLPNEVLVDIFLLLRGIAPPGSREWLKAIQTCRHWHEVAIDAASLWTHIIVRSQEFPMVMLQRSQLAPLQVSFPYHRWRPGTNPTAILDAVLREMARIRTLSFDGQGPRTLILAQMTLLELPRATSMLENLTICIRDLDNSNLRLELALDAYCPPENCLQTLSLSNLQLKWESLLLVASSLRKLTLCDVDTPAPVSGAQFTDVLRQLVNLEQLSLNFDDIQLHDYIAPTPRTPSDRRLKPIDLPRLKNLDIYCRAHLPQLVAFLKHVSYPNLHALFMTFGDAESPVDYSSTIDVIPFSMSKGGFGTLHTLKIFNNRVFMTGDTSNYHDDSVIDLFFPLSTDVRGDDSDVAVITDVLMCFVPQNPNGNPISSLRRLYLGELLISADDFIVLFGHLPHLEFIEVFGELALALFEALALSSLPAPSLEGDQDPAPNTPIAFSKLETIAWQRMGAYIQDYQMQAVIFDALYGSLLARRDRGASLSVLELVGTYRLNSYQAEKLHEVVNAVVVRQW